MPLSTSDISLRWVFGSEDMAVNSRLILYNRPDRDQSRRFSTMLLSQPFTKTFDML